MTHSTQPVGVSARDARNQPRFSVVVPAYNAARTLSDTLDALLAQTLGDWQCVVVDDGSADETLRIAASYARRDQRITATHQSNQGSAGAYNTGVSLASGAFIVICSADDILLPRHLSAMSGFIAREPDYDIYSSNGYFWRPEDDSRELVYGPGERDEINSLRLEDVIRLCFYSVGATYRRGLFETTGGYRRDVYGEDYDFWLRAMASGARHRYLPEPLSLHRLSPVQKSAQTETAYRSDIRLVTDLNRDFTLSAAEKRAVDDCVRERLRLIALVRGPAPLSAEWTRIVARRSTVRLVGEQSTLRLSRTVKSLAGRVRRDRRSVDGSAGPQTRAPERPEHREQPLKVLVIPSWFPSPDQPTAGIFIRQQVEAIAPHADVAVLYVREALESTPPLVSDEGGITIARAQLRMPPVSSALPGRAGAVATNLFNRFYRYPRTGLEAFDRLCAHWGRPDIVHVQALWPAGMIARAVTRRYGIPYVVTEHSEEYLAASERRLVRTPGVVAFLLRPLALNAERTIAVSRFLAARLVALELAVDPLVIPNVVPLSAPTPTADRHPHVISHVSIMGPAKNLEGLLYAVDSLRGRRSDFRLRLVGDGESRVSLEQLAASLGLGAVVQFTGRVPPQDIPAHLADAAFAVVSSTHETFSVSAAESLMCGRPVLSTRCGGPEEFITPQVGRLIGAGSVRALTDGMDWMLDHFREFDPEELHRYARQRFAPDVVAGRIIDVYREVLSDD